MTCSEEIAPPVAEGRVTSTFSHSLPDPMRRMVGWPGVPSSTGVTLVLLDGPRPRELRYVTVTV